MAAPNPPARLNRGLLAVVGLVLAAAGALAAAASLGRSSLLDPRSPVFRTPDQVPGWWAWAGAVIGVVVALAALRWLLAQARRRPSAGTWTWTDPEPRPGADGPRGRTRMVSSAAAAPFVDEVSAHPQVRSAIARLTGTERAPRLDLEVTVDEHADFAAVRAHLEHRALPRLRTALGAPTLGVRLLLRAGSADAGRVR